MTSICDLSACELLDAFRAKSLSPVEVIKAVLDRVDAFNHRLNAFREIDAEGALATAHASEQRWNRGEPCGMLDGIPISVKDLLTTKGMHTFFGSMAFETLQSPDEDAPSVALLRAAGAVIFGKTTTSEFGNKIVTESPLTGITCNPWNVQKSSGGSSGGSAVAVASGMGPLALATDGGGSIRIPSSWCGVFGFKPTFKRVPSDRTNIFGLSNVGPITRTVSDAAVMMNALGAPYPDDWEIIPFDRCNYLDTLDEGIAGLRIAFSVDLGIIDVTDEVTVQVERAATTLRSLGANVERVNVPPLQNYLADGVHSIQWMVQLARIVRGIPQEQRCLLDPDTLTVAAAGENIPTNVLAEALAARRQLASEMHLFLKDYDLLVTSTFHLTACDTPGLPENLRIAPPLTSWCNQTMQPAANIPCGSTAEGLPVGLQIVGRRFCDALVLRASRAFEMARGAFPIPPMVSELR